MNLLGPRLTRRRNASAHCPGRRCRQLPGHFSNSWIQGPVMDSSIKIPFKSTLYIYIYTYIYILYIYPTYINVNILYIYIYMQPPPLITRNHCIFEHTLDCKVTPHTDARPDVWTCLCEAKRLEDVMTVGCDSQEHWSLSNIVAKEVCWKKCVWQHQWKNSVAAEDRWLSNFLAKQTAQCRKQVSRHKQRKGFVFSAGPPGDLWLCQVCRHGTLNQFCGLDQMCEHVLARLRG